MAIRTYDDRLPVLGQRVYVDEQAAVIGDVTIGDDSSIWPFCSIRGDVNSIIIGQRSNIQDNSTIHVAHDSEYCPGGIKTVVGDDVTVGHQVLLHACTIGDCCLIGMGSIIMDNARIAPNTIIGAGSLVTQDRELEGGFLYIGQPVRRIRKLNDEEIERIRYSAGVYLELKAQYLAQQSNT